MKRQEFWHSCIECGSRHATERFLYTCPDCGGLLLVERDDAQLRRRLGAGEKLRKRFDGLRFGPGRRTYPNDSGVWLWRELLLPGFPEDAIVSLKEGQTDLFEVPGWLGRELGLSKLFIKMEGEAPSESFKDRGMPVAVSDALRLQREQPELGIEGVLCASTGDTSAAAAIYSAYVRDRLRCLVLVPNEQVADAQLFQAMAHGAQVKAINHPDGFDGCMKLIQEFSTKHSELVLVNSKNDMRIVGQESIALEICQDLGWRAPDWISIPVGNAGNLTALLRSLLRAKEFGLIDRLPGVIAGQLAGADPLVRWQEGGYQKFEPGRLKPTVATAMNINNPVSFPRVRNLHDQFNLHFYRSQESELKDTWARFMQAGANICPQGAVAVHATLQARQSGMVKPGDTVVAISTASALKFTEAGIRYHHSGAEFANPYEVVNGTLKELENSLVKER